jgi:divalent metal cation (Fe/Co/Zn/Cd) transporter
MATLVPCGFEQVDCSCLPEDNRTLQAGIIAVTMMAKSTPVIRGIMTSLRRRSGDTALASARAPVPSCRLVVMPVLAWAKRETARLTNNRALAADAVQSATCAYLAAVTLEGLAVNAIWHIHWVDSAAALLALPILVIEGRRAFTR